MPSVWESQRKFGCLGAAVSNISSLTMTLWLLQLYSGL